MSFINKVISKKISTDYFIFILLFFIISGLIVSIAYLYTINYKKNYKTNIELQLSSISNLKIQELQRYRKECLSTAKVFNNNPNFSLLAEEYLNNMSNNEAKNKLRIWIKKIQENYQYENVVLINLQCKAVLDKSDSLSKVSSTIKKHISSVIKSKSIEFVDLYRNEFDQKIYISILIPILDISKNNKVIGILQFRINPYSYLFPYIVNWPIQSKSAETLLIRKEDNSVLFLNELRFKKDAVLSMRFSLSDTNVAAVKAVYGVRGIVDAVDYRNIPIIAHINSVPDSPWYLVTKIDVSEAYELYTNELLTIFIWIVMLIIFIALCLLFILKQQRNRFYKEQFQSLEIQRKNDEKYKILVDQAMDGIFIANYKGDYIDVNSAGCNMLGYTRDEILQKNMSDLVKVDNNNPIQYNKLYLGKSILNTRELIKKDGSLLTVQISAKQLPDRNLLGIVRDFTEREQFEKDLFESKELYKNLFNNSQVGLFSTSISDGRILNCNETFAHMAGYETVEECCKDYITSEHYLDKKIRNEVVQKLFKEGAVTNFQIAISDKLGKVLWISYSVKLFKEEGFIEGAAIDITEKKKLEDINNLLITDLQSKNAELEKYTYTVSHDLKAPLITIKGFAGMLEMDIENGNSLRIKDDLKRISAAADKMKILLDDLLSLSRIGRINNIQVQLSLTEIFNDILATFEYSIHEKNVSITIADNLPVIIGDSLRIEEVYQNLIDNAIKYSSNQENPQITIGCLEKDDKWIIFVKDNGIGIEQDYVKRVFGLFEKTDPATDGTGVGLAIVKRIIEFQGDKIWIESEGLGKGTTVFVTHQKQNSN